MAMATALHEALPPSRYYRPLSPEVLFSKEPSISAVPVPGKGRSTSMGNSADEVQRQSDNRQSAARVYSRSAEQDTDVADDLAVSQRRLTHLKGKIGAQSKRNFLLENDVQFLDSRIGLLIQNRMAEEETEEVRQHLNAPGAGLNRLILDERKRKLYGNLFFLLQSETHYLSELCMLISLEDMTSLLQTVMFSIFGNHYDSRESSLLLTLFQAVLSKQFETATEFGSLLRANTPVSRMMTTFTRRGPGQSYLRTILSARINKLMKYSDLSLEIDPMKVHDEIKNAENHERQGFTSLDPASVEKDPLVNRIIAPRLAIISEISDAFLSEIINSVEQVPYGIRWICKQIRVLTLRRYPNATDESISSLIGGFFFLRFINPAIMTPHAHMLVDKMPTGNKNIQRTLTLVAKMLQNTVNKPSYAKERYMAALQGFFETNKGRMNDFLRALCNVPDFYDSLEVDQYMALAKKEIGITISVNELFHTHALLEKYVDKLSTNLQKPQLRQLLQEIGGAPEEVPRAENMTLELSLTPRWELPVEELTSNLYSKANLSTSDVLFMEAKNLFIQLIRSMPGVLDIASISPDVIDLDLVVQMAAMCNDASLTPRGVKALGMLQDLVEMRIVSGSDHYKSLNIEIVSELIHLGNLRNKVSEEIKSLELVYNTHLEQHWQHKYQIESYRQYLGNVRQASSSKPSSSGRFAITKRITSATTKSKGTRIFAEKQAQSYFSYSYKQLQKGGFIVSSSIPSVHFAKIFFSFSCPSPGSYVIAMHYKGRKNAVLEVDLQIDDLLEKIKENATSLDLEYIVLDVPKVFDLLKRRFH